MKALMIILAGLVITWVFTDVQSAHGLFNLFMPLLCVLFAVALLIWLAFTLAGKRIERHRSSAAEEILTRQLAQKNRENSVPTNDD